MNKRKVISLLLLAVLLVAVLAACGKSKKKDTKTSTATPTVQAAPAATATPAATTEPTKAAASTPTTEANASEVVVNIQNSKFDPNPLTIPVGTTVRFVNNDSAAHTATADDGSFDSGNLNKGQDFTFKFDKAGTFAYYCKYHGGKGGTGMSGTIVVQ
jgi:plastocyanin